MKTIVLVLLLALPLAAREIPSQPLPVASPEELGMSANTLAEIDPTVEKLLAKKKLAGASVLVLRKGHVVYQKQFGFRDRKAKAPIQEDTIFRIYSMSKSITSAAALMLYEEGKLGLDDPIRKHLPEFKDLTIWSDLSDPVMALPSPNIRDLLRHTAGFGYGWGKHQVDALYAKADVLNRNHTLADMTRAVSKIPLLYEPGTRWVYGINTDVLARVIEAVSGQTFDVFLQTRLFDPLGMPDTGFHVPPKKVDRFTACYGGGSAVLLTIEPIKGSKFLDKPAHFSGGGGLVSTIGDYGRFLQMIANGGSFQGKRYLEKKTVALMTTNQLPESIPAISFGKEARHGTGFGLGFSVRTAQDQRWDEHAPVGEYGWGGMASTHYWVSPKHELVVVTMEQTVPYNWNLEKALKPIIYRAVR